jgi:RNA polymerase sigma factor (TIGR02999 family)
MRRILVENARRKNRRKNGGLLSRIDLRDDLLLVNAVPEDLIDLDNALERLKAVDPQASELVELRYFGGLGAEEAGELLGLSPRSTYRCWAFAKAWLYSQLGGPSRRLDSIPGEPTRRGDSRNVEPDPASVRHE